MNAGETTGELVLLIILGYALIAFLAFAKSLCFVFWEIPKWICAGAAHKRTHKMKHKKL